MKATFPVLAVFGASVLAVLGVAAVGAQAAQAARTTNDGIFTEAQAKRGSEVYQMACSACHDAQLTGSGTAPALTGADFNANWKDETVGSLFDRIKATMPADNPGSLSRPQTADLVAFILNFNKYPVGPEDLSNEDAALRAIKIAPAK